jgi:cell wall-associated NlpC family hydrolase
VLSTLAQFSRHIVVSCAFAATLLFAPSARANDVEVGQPGEQLAELAQSQIGARYRWGGTSPAGFDCTGFVMWVYSQFGVEMPRSEAGQLATGQRVSADELAPGDLLVFANTYRAGLSHVGIYLGEGQFVHAVDERHGVAVSNLWDAYWAPRFVGASRALA